VLARVVRMASTGLIPTLALLLWVPVSLSFFFLFREERAAILVLLLGNMFLPEMAAFDFPLLPPLDKHSITMLCILIGCLARRPKRILQAHPGRGIERLILLTLVGAVGTALTNADPLSYGRWVTTHLPALEPYDAVSIAIRDILGIALPFFLGRALFDKVEDLKELLLWFSVAGSVYSFFVLLEVRVSPQLHRWVYGYHQHDFVQTLRFGGYRPMVFMSHGLTVALFLCLAFTSSAILAKARMSILRLPSKLVTSFLGVVLLISKSTGAAIYAAVMFLLVFFSRPRIQLRVSLVLAAIVVLYPITRSNDIFPTDTLVRWSQAISVERADSLKFRFDNEDMLVKKALERPWFGWGGFGRGRVYSEDWGRDISITDGYWIIRLGSLGYLGFIVPFGLVLWPIVSLRKKLRKFPDKKDQRIVTGLALMVAVLGVDMLPNGLFPNLPFFLAGALHGTALIASKRAKPVASPAVAT
jgi:hypothetical protein